ncbi:PIN/TRAM domain-containing protein [Paenibacillus sediminis]|uniref:Uncharacterized protein YacL n=1 Tax=Paenibacillus sediminis TaxID=664909 RepID=A0ABS4H787_9BACL|nr:PIN/TRAM domain-containing protein [Paenibacillus sediminis]MBP1938405.1 uncharacterized protein YacL [Paenibacillus sediminis]
MIKRVITAFAGLCGAWAGFASFYSIDYRSQFIQRFFGGMGQTAASLIFAAIGAILFLVICSIVADSISSKLHYVIHMLSRIPMNEMAPGLTGLVAGLLLSLLVYPALSWTGQARELVQLGFALVFGYVGLRVGLEKKEELASLWTTGKWGHAISPERKLEEHKILDTSVIIDGRIADICKTGFIEGTIVIPEFVLEELQHIADSSDLLKRNRGRRGLDILNKIQKELDVKVLIYEGDFEEISEVDSKLVKLAKVLQGKVVTNDYNLNKVCELQGVSVLNINDLANAVKPVVLPGEEIMVQVIKDGKEHGQGVAYLDDGTMIVVEGGREFIGTTMEVLVTSVLQTSAGRMIFAKPKLLEKAQ